MTSSKRCANGLNLDMMHREMFLASEGYLWELLQKTSLLILNGSKKTLQSSWNSGNQSITGKMPNEKDKEDAR